MKNKNNSSAVHLDGSAVKAGVLRVLAVPPRRVPAAPAPGSARPRRGTPSPRDTRSCRVSWERRRRGRDSAAPSAHGEAQLATTPIGPSPRLPLYTFLILSNAFLLWQGDYIYDYCLDDNCMAI